MREPWWSWPERWTIAEEYYYGASLVELEKRYHHDRRDIKGWLASLGILREETVQVAAARSRTRLLLEKRKRMPNRQKTEAIRRLALCLCRAMTVLDRPLTGAEIDRILAYLREENGGLTNSLAGEEKREAVSA